MGWADARTLPWVDDLRPVDGQAAMVDIIRQVLEAELEPMPEGIELEPERPVRAEEKDGRYVTMPSWRFRVQKFWLSFQGCLQTGGPQNSIAVSVQALVAKIALTTSAEKATYDDQRRYSGDWRLIAFDIDRTSQKTRMRRVTNANWAQQAAAAKLVEQMALKEASARGGTLPALAAGPAKTTLERRPDDGVMITIAWFDASHSEEHDNTATGAKVPSSLARYLKSGYFPKAFQAERTEALRLVRARAAAGTRTPDMTALDPDITGSVLDLLALGKDVMVVSKVMRLDVKTVERIAASAPERAKPPSQADVSKAIEEAKAKKARPEAKTP